MQTELSRYYRRLVSQATLHMLADFIQPLIGELPVHDFIIIEVRDARYHLGMLRYCARADFGDGVYSHWYEVRVNPNDGKRFQVIGAYEHLFGHKRGIVTLDLSHEGMYRAW